MIFPVVIKNQRQRSLSKRERAPLFFPFPEFGGCGENRIAGGIQRRFHGVLNHADDEPDADEGHGNIRCYAEEGAAERNQQEGSAGDAGRGAQI